MLKAVYQRACPAVKYFNDWGAGIVSSKGAAAELYAVFRKVLRYLPIQLARLWNRSVAKVNTHTPMMRSERTSGQRIESPPPLRNSSRMIATK